MSRTAGLMLFTTVSPMRIVPASGFSKPLMQRKVVVLPQPDGPRNTMNSWSSTLRSRSRTATTSPKRLVIFSTLTLAIRLLQDLAAHRAEGHAAQQVISDQEGKDEDRHDEHGRHGGDDTPVDPGAGLRLRGDEGRHRLGGRVAVQDER